jgi:hypothetical protein
MGQSVLAGDGGGEAFIKRLDLLVCILRKPTVDTVALPGGQRGNKNDLQRTAKFS